jgi:hypothetical protein
MVMAKTDFKPFPKPIPKPLPAPVPMPGEHPGPTGCIPPQPISLPFLDMKRHQALDENNDGNLNRDEFNAGLNGLEKLVGDKKFDGYDKDDNGYVSQDEYLEGKKKDRESRLQLPIINVGRKAAEAVKESFNPFD